jgi:serine/threonine-protein kinase
MPQHAASAADPWIGKLVQGRFRVLEKLGAGGMGVVYKAEQVAMRRPVALKMLHPTLVQDPEVVTRFENEAAACSKLTHPNTITVHDFGQAEDGSLFIAMEFVSGSSLEQVLRESGALPWARAVKVAQQICASLAEAHAHGIVHRDLKPGNIMLFERGGSADNVKVLDFGIAKICEGAGGVDQRQALTRTGMVFGTPQYMSPEQIKGERVGPRSDLYAVGVILYEMLTGELPFSAETPMGMLTKHLLELPRPLRQALPGLEIPLPLERAVLTAMAKNGDERQASMDVLARDLDACLAEASTVRATPATHLAEATPVPQAAIAATRLAASGPQIELSPPPRRGSRGALVGVLAALGLCVVGIGAWTLSRASSGEEEPRPLGLAGGGAPSQPVHPGPGLANGVAPPLMPVTPATTNVTSPVAPVGPGACALVGVERAAPIVDLLGGSAGRLRACATAGSLRFRYRITGRSPSTADLETTPTEARACVEAAIAGIPFPPDSAGRVDVRMSVEGAACAGRVEWSRAGHGGRGPGKKDEVLPGR